MDDPWAAYPVVQQPQPQQSSSGWDAYPAVKPDAKPAASPWDAYPVVHEAAPDAGRLPPAKIDEGSAEPPPAASALDEGAFTMGARLRSGLPAQPTAAETAPNPNGMKAAAESGIADSLHNVAAAPGTLARQEMKPVAPAPYKDPVHVSDLLHPDQIGPKIAYQLSSSMPTMAGGILGGVAGEAVAPESGPIAPLAGGAAGAGAVTAVQTLAPYYAEEMHKPGATPDTAFHAALARAGQSGAFSSAGWALFGFAPFASAAKNILGQAFVVQPGVGAAERATENVEQGKPVGEGVGEAALNAGIGTAIPAAGHAIVHAAPDIIAPQPAAAPLHADAAALTDMAAAHQALQPTPAAQAAKQTLVNIAAGKPADAPVEQPAQAVAQAGPWDAYAKVETPPEQQPRATAPNRAEQDLGAPTRAEPTPQVGTGAEPTPDVQPPTAPYTMVRPGDLTLDPKRFQYKQSDENGVTGALQGVKRWDSNLADPIDAYRDTDGKLYVVNGHQRTDLANRAVADGQQDVQMPARIYDAADGYTPEQMRYLGAYRNIAQGSGTAIDAAKIMRAPVPEGMVPPELPPKSAIVQQAQGLKNLSDEAFGAAINGVIPAPYAAEVGRQISDPKQQMAAIQVLHQADPPNVEQARIMVADVKNSGFLDGQQEDMFGTQAFAQSLFPERAKVLAQALQTLRGNKRVFQAAVQGEDALTSAGNRMDTAANQKGQTENEQLVDLLQRAATTRGPISDALSASARDVASGKAVRGASADFLGRARTIIRRGADVGVEPGADLQRAGPPGEAGASDAGLELPPQEGPGLFSAREAGPATEGAPAEHLEFQSVAEHMMRFTGVPESVTLKLFDRLGQQGPDGRGTADGTYADKLIRFALDTPPDQVPAKLFHEIVHALRDPSLGLMSPVERAALDAGASRYLATGNNRAEIVKRYTTDGKPPPANVVREEAIARMAEEALTKALAKPTLGQRVAARLANFVRGLGQALRGQGFKTADDVFNSIMQGRLAGRAEGAHPIVNAPRVVGEMEARRPLITDKAGLEREGQGALFGRSAVQAQAARDAAEGRGRGEQKPMDEGLFAPKQAEQPSLAPPHGQPMHDAAAEVVRFGKENGRETLRVYNPLTDRIEHQSDGASRSVQMPESAKPILNNPTHALVFQHNHPTSSALSADDIGQLIYPGGSWVVAHGHDGSFSAAKAPDGTLPTHETKGATDPELGRAQIAMINRYNSANTVASGLVRKLINDGKFTVEKTKGIWNDIINRTMAIRGDIDYISSFKLPAVIVKALQDYARESGRGAGVGSNDRFTQSVQPSEGIARVAEDARRLAQQRAAGAGGDRADAQVHSGPQAEPAAGRPPLVKGEQGRLFSLRDDGRDVAERERNAAQISIDLTQPRGRASLEPIKAIVRNAQEILSPTSLDGAKPTEWTVRKNAAEQARSFARTVADLSDMRDAMNRLPVEEQHAFTDRMEAGEKQATPELQAVADMLRTTFDGWAKKIQSLGKGYLEDTIEHYAPHIWGNYREWKAGLPTDPNADPMDRAVAGAMSKSPIRGSGAFLKQRTFATQREGIEAGLIPVSSNPVDLAMIKLREMQKMYHGTRMAEEMKQTGIAQWVPVSAESAARGAGWVKLDDAVFKPTTSEFGGRTEFGSYWAPAEAARIFNNYTSRGISDSPIYGAIRASGNALNQLQLGLSGFHATFVTLDSAISKVAMGLRQVAGGVKRLDPALAAKGAGNVALGSPPLIPVAAAMTAYRGGQLRKAILYPEAATPEMRRIADLAMKGGARVAQQQIFRADARGSFVRNMGDFLNGHIFREIANTARNEFANHGPILGAITTPIHMASRLIETTMQPLMELYVPRAKLGVFYDMANDWAQRNPDATPEATADAMTKAWDSVDNRMGQMVYDNLFWNKTAKDLAFISTRSVGWNLGTIRELAGAGVDTAAQAARLAQLRSPELTHRMAYAMAMPLVTGMLGGTMTYLLTGQGPQSLLDYFYPKKSDGTRLAIPGYIKDVIDYTHAPIQTAANKMHPLLSMAQQLANNRDYYGGIIRDPQRDGVLRPYLEYLTNQIEPFALRAIQKENSQGATEMEKIAAFWGFQPAPAAIANPEKGDTYQRRLDQQAYRKRMREPGRAELPGWVP